MKREKLEQMLLQVQKPAQYIGGELNSVMKDKTRVDCRRRRPSSGCSARRRAISSTMRPRSSAAAARV